ncbi:unnamed protein product [Paramecium primaurelia]|uniref:Core Histone H2A/H2B/H3 domain-containing protein n=1 Tax=Paramecium primaurelia TaxID=5886 RepID=A0A8S1MWG8_PARPR|nr:unnamed protein product [Paramecium primaurelia]
MANRNKKAKENNNQSFQVDNNEQMPSFMHSLFNSDEKSIIEEKSNEVSKKSERKKDERISGIQVQKARDKLQKRNKPMSKVLQEIRQLQTSSILVCRRAGFQRFVRWAGIKVSDELGFKEFRYSSKSLECLQTLTEQYMVDLFEDSVQCTFHAKRVTLMAKDLNLTARIRGIEQPLQEIRNLKLN